MQAFRWLRAAVRALPMMVLPVMALPILALTSCTKREAAPPLGTGKPMTASEFRRELVNLPLCGTPATGPVAGKAMCTVHFSDGQWALAGAGLVARGFWQFQGDGVCRRDRHDPVEQERCVRYERLPNGRYRNSEGVVLCLGPCGDR